MSELEQTFSPEGLCARCNILSTEFSEVFIYHGTGGVRESQSLGFCSNECHDAFVDGIAAAKELTVL